MSGAGLASGVVQHGAEAPATPFAAWVVVVALLLGSAAVVWAFVRLGGSDGTDPGHEDGDGGGGSTTRRPPGTPPQDGPVSWPEFERQFAAYVAAGGRGDAALREVTDRQAASASPPAPRGSSAECAAHPNGR